MGVPENMIQKALELDPDNGAYLDSLGWVYLKKGDLDKAREYLQKAVDAEASDAVLREHLGDVYLKKGMKDAAKAQWDKSLELDPKNDDLRKKYKDAGFGEPPTPKPAPDEKGHPPAEGGPQGSN